MTEGTILIAGATGRLGSRLAHRLADRGRRVVAAVRPTSELGRLGTRFRTCDVTASDSTLRRQFERFGIGTVINCIADYGDGGVTRSRVVDANLITPLRLLEAGFDVGVSTFLNTHTSLPHDVGPYALAKHQLTDWLAGATVPPVRINAVLEQFYGPGDGDRSVVSSIVDRLLAAPPAIAATASEQRRDLVFIDDVLDAYETLLDAAAGLGDGFHEFPIGGGPPVAERDVFELARELTGNTRTTIRYGTAPYRDVEVMHSEADLRPMASLGWTPRVGLREGIAAVVADACAATDARAAA